MNKTRFRDWTRRDGPAAILFLVPGFLGFSLFYIFPFALGVGYSFRDRTVGGTFVGFDNYKALLARGSFRHAAGNTLLFTGIAVPVLIVFSLTFVLLLNNRTRFRRGFQTAFVLPLVVPVASIVMIWQTFVDWNGILNAWLNAWGPPRVDWMNSDSSMGV
ncbi:carbohydrate ABC transporter permease [Paenibacillus cymbidii]|uniref:carbohydrate ABC transporter permease n=1 Tax=Paenibacillus cymbidii TaxID=1639034 RepID=UPI001436A607|nr:sugar ABC transporter permease [Paenibacillus cymbidii]